MRLSTRVVALCVGLLVSHQATAAELPQRWVSAGGALSEWVSALGGESKLVGVDTTSQHPESLKALPSIGYQRQLSAEGVLSLRPQILVGTEEMGPPPVLSQIRSAGVQVELFSAQPDLPTLQGNLQHLGKLLGAEDRASQVFLTYQQQLDQQQARVSQAQLKHKAPGVLLLLGHAGGKPLIAGKDTAADWLLQHAGGHNLATHTGQSQSRSAGICRPCADGRCGACGVVQGESDPLVHPSGQGRASHGAGPDFVGGGAGAKVAGKSDQAV